MSLPTTTKQIVLKQRPNKDTLKFGPALFDVKDVPLPELKDGQFLVEVTALSCDPTQRIWVTDAPQYMPPVEIGEPMRALVGGIVRASKNAALKAGDHVVGFGEWTQFIVASDGYNKVPDIQVGITLGLTGATAYIGLCLRGQLKYGETVVVSGAAGSTGSIVVQLAKAMGCRVIGTAGGPEKCKRVIEEYGADACIDYKNENVFERMAALAPGQVDVFFDNVGGPILDAVLMQLAMHARVVICGAISGYEGVGNGVPSNAYGPKAYSMLLMRRATMQGFIFMDSPAEVGAALARLGKMFAEGKLKLTMDPTEAPFVDAPKVVAKLFDGSNKGKLIHVVAKL